MRHVFYPFFLGTSIQIVVAISLLAGSFSKSFAKQPSSPVIPAVVTPSAAPVDNRVPLKDPNPKSFAEPRNLPAIPMVFPPASADNRIHLKDPIWGDRVTTIIPALQNSLKSFLMAKGDPIGGVVVADVRTGQILAAVQGENPKLWGSDVNTVEYPGFPAASLFKIATALAVLEAKRTSNLSYKLVGGCAEVKAWSMWLGDDKASRLGRHTTLGTAFADSCNNFFGKLALDEVGLGPITYFANQLGWGEVSLSADFNLAGSPIHPPAITHSGVEHVLRYAAGFGEVGLSPLHGAWLALAVANKGETKPLTLFADTPAAAKISPNPTASKRIFSEESALELLSMFQKTVKFGTASGVYKNRMYRKFRLDAGGKTGTLNSISPEGLATWYLGVYPVTEPEVVISSIVLIKPKDRWVIKGSQLAAESLRLWYENQHKEWSPVYAKSEIKKPQASVYAKPKIKKSKIQVH